MTGHFLCHSQVQAEGRVLDQAEENPRVEKSLAEHPHGLTQWIRIYRRPKHTTSLPRRTPALCFCCPGGWTSGRMKPPALSCVTLAPRLCDKKPTVHNCWWKQSGKNGGVFSLPHLSGAWTPSRKPGATWLHPSLTPSSPRDWGSN